MLNLKCYSKITKIRPETFRFNKRLYILVSCHVAQGLVLPPLIFQKFVDSNFFQRLTFFHAKLNITAINFGTYARAANPLWLRKSKLKIYRRRRNIDKKVVLKKTSLKCIFLALDEKSRRLKVCFQCKLKLIGS